MTVNAPFLWHSRFGSLLARSNIARYHRYWHLARVLCPPNPFISLRMRLFDGDSKASLIVTTYGTRADHQAIDQTLSQSPNRRDMYLLSTFDMTSEVKINGLAPI